MSCWTVELKLWYHKTRERKSIRKRDYNKKSILFDDEVDWSTNIDVVVVVDDSFGLKASYKPDGDPLAHSYKYAFGRNINL
jgi:hypothetical protein